MKLAQSQLHSRRLLLGAVSGAALSLALIGPTAFAQDIQALDSPKRISGQYIVVLKENHAISVQASDAWVKSRANGLMKKFGGKMKGKHFHRALKGFTIHNISQGQLKKLAKDADVAFVEADQVVSINTTQNNATWGLDRIDQDDLPLDNTYTYDNDGSGVHAYVVDTGIRGSHVEFSGRMGNGFTAINDGQGTNDCNGHGTHVAGTVGGTTWGVAKGVTLHPIRVLGCNGSGSNSGVIAGIDWVANNHVAPAVANMSLGGGASTAVDNAVQNAINQGVSMVVAAGNDNSNACNFSPARAANAVTVGSTTSSDARSSFSNFGTCVDIFGPGSSITSAWSTGNTATNTISGTSMASPHVAGVAALYLETDPSASPTDVTNALIATAVQNTLTGVGSGSPNLLVNVDSGSAPPPPPPPPPPPGGTPTLNNGDSVNNISGSGTTGGAEFQFWKIAIPTGASNLVVQMRGGSGDADLYVRAGQQPTLLSHDCRPFRNGNNETCTINSPSTGDYYIGIDGYSNYAGVTLSVSYDEPSGGGGGGGSVDDLSASAGNWVRYTIDVPAGASELEVKITGGSGDADLYVRRGSQPSTSQYDCRPYRNGNEETCTFNNPAAGTYHLGVRAFRTFSGVTLSAFYE